MSAFPPTWGNLMLKDLAETTVPDQIDFWPQTIGWKIVAILAVIYFLLKIYGKWRIYKRNAYRREALEWLEKLPKFVDIKDQAIYRQLPSLIRNVAIEAFGRDQISLLIEDTWEQWLDEQCDKTSFANKYSKFLHSLSYAPQPKLSTGQIELLVDETKIWVKYHRGNND